VTVRGDFDDFLRFDPLAVFVPVQAGFDFSVAIRLDCNLAHVIGDMSSALDDTMVRATVENLDAGTTNWQDGESSKDACDEE